MKARSTPGPEAAQANAIWEQLATRRSPLRAQAKLAVGKPDDPAEHEADRIADQIMRMPAPCVQTRRATRATRPPSCPECDQEAKVQRQAHGAAGPATVTEGFSSQFGAGAPLAPAARAFFEPRFGGDFSSVLVHADARADASARSVNALAFTLGNHLVFRSGAYSPNSHYGRHLLAHELAHVLQQRAAGASSVVQRVFLPTDLMDPSGAGLQSNPIASNPETYFFPGTVGARPGRRAVVIAGIHGSEPSARALGHEIQSQLASHSVTPFFHTVLVPQVNPSPTASRAAGRGRTSVADLNREFGTGYTSPSPFAQRVTNIVNEFDPERILSIHAISNPALGGIFLDPIHARATPRVGESGRAVDIRSYPPVGTPAELQSAFTGDMANLESMRLTERMIGAAGSPGMTVPGNQPTSALPASTYPAVPGATSTQSPYSLIYPLQGSVSRGVSLGTWASGHGRTVVTLEIPGYGAPASTWRNFLPSVWEFLRQAPSSTTTGPSTTGTGGAQGQQTEPAPSEEDSSESLITRILRWLRRFFEEIGRVLGQSATMPEPLPREAAPSTLPRNCLTFSSQSDLDTRLAHWEGVIAGMTSADVVNWIVGATAPPTAATREATRQRDCLLHAIRAAAARPGSTIRLPRGGLSHSGHRSAADQATIWREKFEFSRARPFDRISDHARSVCGSLLLPSETRWNTGEPRHRACWGVPPRPGATAASMPLTARALTADERQAEILQASSAPGVSRHHWGSDFDLFDPDMNPAEWETGGAFADEYSWMMRNASTYGFIQSFTAGSTFMSLGYMEERWHWSYFPISQALLEFVRAHDAEIQTALTAQWSANPSQFTFISRHWRDFMFNVRQRGQF